VRVNEKASVTEAEFKVRELKEILRVEAVAVRQETPVGSDEDAVSDGSLVLDEDTKAGVL
jgi:hypothetical protein